MSPDWHDKPTEPGLWYLPQCSIYLLTQTDVDGGLYVHRCFGPIPPDNASGVQP